ncbi:MAG: carboxymuconolactone decarboxylase family protein [Armatimonadetes bacterium]|nr:carboxymuconolactone decarboxylase family protein [Armatimonadota bacterium]
MNREQVYDDVTAHLGFVPEFLDHMPDATLGPEWEVFKLVQMEDETIPMKYRELMGLAIAAVLKCKYCLFYHRNVSKAAGATDAEIEAAMHMAKNVVGWSTWLTGLAPDYERFQQDVLQACDNMQANGGAEQQRAA